VGASCSLTGGPQSHATCHAAGHAGDARQVAAPPSVQRRPGHRCWRRRHGGGAEGWAEVRGSRHASRMFFAMARLHRRDPRTGAERPGAESRRPWGLCLWSALGSR